MGSVSAVDVCQSFELCHLSLSLMARYRSSSGCAAVTLIVCAVVVLSAIDAAG